MPGDILEYTKEYIENVRPQLPGYWGYGKTFTVSKILDSFSDGGRVVYISFKEISNGDRFPMEVATGADFEFKHLYSGPAFKIVKLAGD